MDYPLYIKNLPSERDIPLSGPGLDKMLRQVTTYAGRSRPLTNLWTTAMDIIAAMVYKGYWCTITSPTTRIGGKWWAGFTPHGKTATKPHYRASATSGPLAVARAAVLCVLEMQEQKEV